MDNFNQAAMKERPTLVLSEEKQRLVSYRLNPHDASIAAAYGALLSDKKKYAEAGTILMTALHSHPDNAEVLKALSEHFMHVKNFHAAKTCLNKAENKPYHHKEWHSIADRAASIAKREQANAAKPSIEMM